jgi:hypothetical protein
MLSDAKKTSSLFSPKKQKQINRISRFSEQRYKPVSFLASMTTKAVKIPVKSTLPEHVRRSHKANQDMFNQLNNSPTRKHRGFLL